MKCDLVGEKPSVQKSHICINPSKCKRIPNDVHNLAAAKPTDTGCGIETFSGWQVV
jgi:hypothetical protein